MSTLATALTLLGFSVAVNAHLKLNTPVPYDKNTITTSPLTEGQFPCQVHTYAISSMNNMAAGSPQTLSLDGDAVHGGGSCQLAVSLDQKPTAQSTFKVIKSWIGGCPVTQGQSSPDHFNYSIPQGFPNGQATLSWTWNSLEAGQDELYMNCAPIMVTGGSSDKTVYNSLPDLSKVNIPGVDCKQVVNTNPDYVNPGPDAETLTSQSLAAPTGAACEKKTAGGAAPPASATSGASSPSSAPASSSAAATTSAAAAPSSSAPAAGSGTSTTFATSFYTVTSGAAATPTGGSNSSGSGSSSSGGSFAPTSGSGSSGSSGSGSSSSGSDPMGGSGSSNSTGSSSGSGSSSCSTNGAVVCNGPTQFGLCNNGNVAFQAVAAGTTCSNGQIMRKRR
ncbi:MAG: hypothetical protein M1821_003383 [Bathelium mastoideum]|nr:MAG: hypothetical protein M1821_003383 [Bathelium mastoideum]